MKNRYIISIMLIICIICIGGCLDNKTPSTSSKPHVTYTIYATPLPRPIIETLPTEKPSDIETVINNITTNSSDQSTITLTLLSIPDIPPPETPEIITTIIPPYPEPTPPNFPLPTRQP